MTEPSDGDIGFVDGEFYPYIFWHGEWCPMTIRQGFIRSKQLQMSISKINHVIPRNGRKNG